MKLKLNTYSSSGCIVTVNVISESEGHVLIELLDDSLFQELDKVGKTTGRYGFSEPLKSGNANTDHYDVAELCHEGEQILVAKEDILEWNIGS